MNDVQIFKNDKLGLQVRVILNEDGSVSMNAEDTAIGYGWYRVEEKNGKQYKSIMWARMNGYCKDLGFAHECAKDDYIPETLYYLLGMKASNENAKPFQMWIAADILPMVRKHGAYMTPQKIEEVLTDPDTLFKFAAILKEEQEKRKSLEIETAQQKQIIGELKPKADYTDYILKNKSLVTITQIAKDYGMSGQAMNKLLHELDVQYKLNDQWLLYAKYHNKGYTQSNTYPIERKDGTVETKMQTEWTQKGRLFIYNLLKAEGIIPMIERDDRKGRDQNVSGKKEEAPICR